MNKLTRKLLAGALVLLTFMPLVFPQRLSAGECEKAVVKCLIDIGVVAVVGLVAGAFSANPLGVLYGVSASGGAYLMFCLIGYEFCKLYYEKT